MTEQRKRFVVIAGIILMAVMSRLLPHPYNFTPIAAMALFGGAYFMDRKWAFAVPLLAMFISDSALQILYATGNSHYPGFYPDMLFVYMGIALIVGIGTRISQRVGIMTVAAASLSASVLFFALTNFGAWLSISAYPKNFAGLIQAYVAGIPFFRWTLIGDLVYSSVIFGAFELVLQRRPQWKLASS